MVIFGIMPDGKVETIYNWENSNNETATRLAKLLYDINNGDYESRIMHDLVNMPLGQRDRRFIGKALNLWSEKLNSTRPAVRPLAFLKGSE
jgi:hypothetical protein